MSLGGNTRRRRFGRRQFIQLGSVLAIFAVLVAGAVIAQGFDVQQTPVSNASLWVMQSGQGQRYARVNTAIAELDSVNEIEKPSSIVQNESAVLLYSNGDGRLATVNQANPINYGEDPAAFTKTPDQTTSVAAHGNVVAYLTGPGSVWVSLIQQGVPSEPVQIGTDVIGTGGGSGSSGYVADAVAVSDAGIIYVYSATDSQVRQYDPNAQKFVGGADAVSGGPQGENLQLSVVGESWVLFNPDGRKIWVRGIGSEIDAPADVTSQAQLQLPSAASNFAYVATTTGLLSINLSDGAVKTVTTATGTPAHPRALNGIVFAAWLPSTGEQGTLFNTATNEALPLDYNGKTLSEDAEPVFQINQDRMVVNDTQSGWVWRVPDGSLIPSSQDWNLAKQVPETNSNVAEVQKVTDPKPPVAVSDSFGVRAGKLSSLPVLLNDHDPNEGDVLSVIPSSVAGLDPGFGSASAANNSQMVSVFVAAGASASTSLSYQITDGSDREGLNSEPATISLTIVPDEENSAPQWCGDVMEDCTQVWPSPQLEPGGTLDINFLDGWLDQQGDSFFITSVDNPAGVGAVAFEPSGRLVYQHNNPALDAALQVPLTVRVSDEYGAVTEKTLTITVTPTPQFSLDALVRTMNVGESLDLDLAPYLHGTSGVTRISTASFTKDTTAQLSVVGRTQLHITATEPDSLTVSTTITDSLGEHLAYFRVTVLDPAAGALSTTPVTIYVAPGGDSSTDVFSAIDNPAGQPLVLSDAIVNQDPTAALFADVVENRYLHVRGITANGLPGRLGTIDYQVSDGSGNANAMVRGQATVYMLPVPPSTAPVAVNDEVTVRAGEQVDVAVLANDVGPAGAALIIDPLSIPKNCVGDGLAFASQRTIRVLAPAQAQDYVCSYSVYAQGNTVQRGSASLVIHVIDAGANNAPTPPTLHSQVLAGQSVEIPFEPASSDVDGDRLSLTAVGLPQQGFATISDTGQAIIYTSMLGQSGPVSFSYTVTDSNGATGEGTVKVGVLNQEPIPGPVTYTDYVEILPGATNQAVVNPVLNDIDSEKGGLKLVADSVIPTVDPTTPNGQAQFDAMAAHIKQDDTNAVTITSLADPGIMSFQYTVQSESGSRSIGYIAVRVVADIAPNNPVIIDTYLTQLERSQLSAGIDVVTNKVTWSSGNVGNLQLSLWGSANGFSASGSKISGVAPDEGALVPFQLTGKDFSGQDITSYGFLHVPSSQNFALTLRADKAMQTVTEKETVTFDMNELVSLPTGTTVEVGAAEVKAMGQRAQATCASSGNTSISYASGEGEPWTDGCIVPVRISGSQDSYTPLLVPITVIPLNPEPVLSPRKITVTPGKAGTQVIDLKEMTKWYGHDDLSSLTYSYSYNQSDFTIEQTGQSLSIMARGNATQGATNTVTISVSNHPATKPADIILIVGQAPNNAPTGGSLTLQCESNQQDCSASVSQISGAYNPIGGSLTFAPFNYDGKNANYDAASNSVVCGSARLRATPTQIIATMDGTRGANCPSITYQVINEDDRNGPGYLNFTLLGVPDQIGGARQSDYTETTVTLAITPGAAADVEPPLLGYHIYQDGSSNPIDCPVSESEMRFEKECDIAGLNPYTGKNNQDKHTYAIKPYNRIGDATVAVSVSNVYAYRPLNALGPDVFKSVTPVYRNSVTKPNVGALTVTLQPVSDPAVDHYEILADGFKAISVAPNASGTIVADPVLATPGNNTHLRVRAVGLVNPPVGSASQDVTADWYGRVSGGPGINKVSASTPTGSGSNWQVSVSFSGSSSFSTVDGKMVAVLYPSGTSQPRCAWNESNNTLTPPSGAGIYAQPAVSVGYSDGAKTSGLVAFSGLPSGQTFTSMVCYTNGFGVLQKDGTAFATYEDPIEGAFTYAVSDLPVNGAWLVALVSSTPAPGGGTWHAEFADVSLSEANPVWGQSLTSTVFGQDMKFKVRYCANNGTGCTPGNQFVQLADGNRAWQMKPTRAFLAAPSGEANAGAELVPQTCQFNSALTFNVAGDGVGAFGASNWAISGTPQYNNGTGWANMEDTGTGDFYIPDSASTGASTTIKIQLSVTGNSWPPQIAGLVGAITMPEISQVTCSL